MATAAQRQGEVGSVEGKITALYTVWCLYCEEWEEVDAKNREGAATDARRRGWKYLGGFHAGWTCPTCKKKGD